MWNCAKCREEIEDSFDACWRCGTTKDGVEDPHFLAKQSEAFTAAKPIAKDHSNPSATVAHDTRSRYRLASILIWVLRGLAFLALIWGIISFSNALDSSRVANEALRKVRHEFQGPEGEQLNVERAFRATAAAASTAVMTAMLLTVCLMTVLLATAEGLRLCIQIERNTRATGAEASTHRGRL